MVLGDDYTYQKLDNGSWYLLFFHQDGIIDYQFADTRGNLMVDFHAYHTFEQGKDYNIFIDSQNPYISKLKWNYAYESRSIFNYHPDFSHNAQFTIKYPSLEWSEAKDLYIHDVMDNFTFRPEEKHNISLIYLKDAQSNTFSVEFEIPQDHYDNPEIFKDIYGIIRPIGDTYNEEVKLFKFPNWAYLYYLQQNDTVLYEYTILFDELRGSVPEGYEIVPDSNLFLEAVYNSSQLRYRLQAHPFNYEYIGNNYPDFDISLTINDGDPILSSQPEFFDYVEDIENRYIYFKNETDIPHQSNIKLSYKAKMQPGLLERKHLMIIAKPWSNTFDTIANDVEANNTIYREKYRKLGGGSIITPFEYSLSIDDTYSLYLSYRLNQKQYYEKKFNIDYEGNQEYTYLTGEEDDYIEELKEDGDYALTIYYFDQSNKFRILDKKFYEDPDISNNKITLKKIIKDGEDINPITAINSINEFYVSFLPKARDVEFSTYKFSFNPQENITKTINVNNWKLLGANDGDLQILPNLNQQYYVDEEKSTETNTVCYASQLATYLESGRSIEFNLISELNGFLDNQVKDGIRNGNYLSLYMETQMQNVESLEFIKIELIDKDNHVMSGYTNKIYKDELDLWENELKIDLPTSTNYLQKIRITPYFREDKEFNPSNKIGVPYYEYVTFTNESLTSNSNGQSVFEHTLEYEMLTNLEDQGYNFAYIFDKSLNHITFQENYDLSYNVSTDPYTKQDVYDLHIPLDYIDPLNNNTTLRFQNDDLLIIRYNKPVERGISIGIGEIYLQRKPAHYDSSVSPAECLLVNTESPESYSSFTNDYYQIPIRLTPFDTEFSNTFKSVKYDINLTTLKDYATNGILDFSNITFTINDPSYELTIDEVLIMQDKQRPSLEQESLTQEVWQHSELQVFRSSESPENDEYQLELDNKSLPLFFPDTKWIDYINVYDEDDNYYSVGIDGDDYQLWYE
ncbi:MAG: hypothetical protein P8Y97_15545, partial [Candidatus Lokiarchaeota archaeon]